MPSAAETCFPAVARPPRDWRAAEASGVPYPERADEPRNAADRLIGRLTARVRAPLATSPRRYARAAQAINELAGWATGLADAEIRAAALALRPAMRRYGPKGEPLARCFALGREAAERTLGRRPYPVQVLAGLAIADGALAEMQTGEGKTLSATLPALAMSLAGLPVHVVTVNDYLAARDAAALTPFYAAFGLSVGVVQSEQDEAARRSAYACDVTYVVNKELTFDYLRDRLAAGPRRSAAALALSRLSGERAPALLLRGLGCAILDEADSILIDEAAMPLIISGATGELEAPYGMALQAADALRAVEDYVTEAGGARLALTARGKARLAAGVHSASGVWSIRRAREDLVCQALAARHLYHRDRHYVVQDDKVQIIDPHTGRIADGRAWQHGLHQLIEAKESCSHSERRSTLASITYQRFFGRYLHLSGMSGTLHEVAPELWATYDLRTVRIPTHRPSRRVQLGTRLLADQAAKGKALVQAVGRLAPTGQPVLVGAASVEASEAASAILWAAGIAHVTLNANHPAEEADIVAAAGQRGQVTIATNMAGRGTDIIPGPGVAALGGLHVILTEHHESSRIDRQFVGRGGRQGDRSSTETLCALDDALFTRHASGAARLLGRFGALGRCAPLAAWLRRRAQAQAEREAARQRQSTMRAERQTDASLGFAWSE